MLRKTYKKQPPRLIGVEGDLTSYGTLKPHRGGILVSEKPI